jgi:MFS family permease
VRRIIITPPTHTHTPTHPHSHTRTHRFFVGYISRPAGAILFGHLGDTRGRSTCLLISVLVMGIPTVSEGQAGFVRFISTRQMQQTWHCWAASHPAHTRRRSTRAALWRLLTRSLDAIARPGWPQVLIGCLPTYAHIGLASPIILAILRLIQGLAMGGEFGAGELSSSVAWTGRCRGLSPLCLACAGGLARQTHPRACCCVHPAAPLLSPSPCVFAGGVSTRSHGLPS